MLGETYDSIIVNLQAKAKKNLNSENLAVWIAEKEWLDSSTLIASGRMYEYSFLLHHLYMELWREQQKNASQEEIGAWMKRMFGTNYIESFSEEEFIEWRNKL